MNRTVSLIYVIAFVLLLSFPAFSQAKEDSVYITRTGERYHASGCRYLKSGAIAVTRSQAQKSGYTPCSVCKPGSGNSATAPVSTYQKGQTAARQCTGTTQSGQRCRRMTTSANGRCYQH